MQPYIDAAKDTVNNTIKILTENFDDYEFRVAFVGYRDFDDKEDTIFSIFNFPDEELNN